MIACSTKYDEQVKLKVERRVREIVCSAKLSLFVAVENLRLKLYEKNKWRQILYIQLHSPEQISDRNTILKWKI